MRITYLNPSGQMGGGETSLLELLAGVRAAQPDWTLSLILGETGPMVAKAEALGVSTQVVPFPPRLASLGDSSLTPTKRKSAQRFEKLFRTVAAIPQIRIWTTLLASVLRGSNPDVIHSHGFKMHLLGLWARPSRTPFVWHIQDYVNSRPLMRKLLRTHSHKCAAIIANSKSVREDIISCCAPKVNVATIYNGVNLSRFSPVGPMMDLDAAAGLPPATAETVRVGLLGTFAKWKGHHLFLEALSLIPPTVAVRGYIIGAPIYQTTGSQSSMDELRAQARHLGLTERVGFTGFVDAPETAIRALDIVVHASTKPEPFGMVIVEAMACGKVVVASNTSGASELFSDGKDALTYPCANAVELAKRITMLQVAPALRARIGEAGRRSVEGILNNSRVASEVIAIYHGILRGHAQSSIATSKQRHLSSDRNVR